MPHEMLDNLVKARKLHRADPSAEEVSNLIRMGLAKLKDASHAVEEPLIAALIRVAEIIAERVQHSCDFGGD